MWEVGRNLDQQRGRGGGFWVDRAFKERDSGMPRNHESSRSWYVWTASDFEATVSAGRHGNQPPRAGWRRREQRSETCFIRCSRLWRCKIGKFLISFLTARMLKKDDMTPACYHHRNELTKMGYGKAWCWFVMPHKSWHQWQLSLRHCFITNQGKWFHCRCRSRIFNFYGMGSKSADHERKDWSALLPGTSFRFLDALSHYIRH